MTVRFTIRARRELDDAVAWYEVQVPGLGMEFLDELDRAVRRISVYPSSGSEIGPELRRCFLARFPYGLIYGRDEQSLVIVAVAHLHRRPRYWRGRGVKG